MREGRGNAVAGVPPWFQFFYKLWRETRTKGGVMSGQANLFSRFGFQTGADGKIDNNTRAFFSKFKGRVGPAIPDLPANASWAQIAVTVNALIKEFVAQGWVQKGFDADATAFADAVQAVTMIPAATE